MAFGALAGPLAVASPTAGLVLAGYGLYTSFDLLVAVLTNPNSTVGQKTTAITIFLASTIGARAALKYTRAGNPWIRPLQMPQAQLKATVTSMKDEINTSIEQAQQTYRDAYENGMIPENAGGIEQFLNVGGRVLPCNEVAGIISVRLAKAGIKNTVIKIRPQTKGTTFGHKRFGGGWRNHYFVRIIGENGAEWIVDATNFELGGEPVSNWKTDFELSGSWETFFVEEPQWTLPPE